MNCVHRAAQVPLMRLFHCELAKSRAVTMTLLRSKCFLIFCSVKYSRNLTSSGTTLQHSQTHTHTSEGPHTFRLAGCKECGSMQLLRLSGRCRSVLNTSQNRRSRTTVNTVIDRSCFTDCVLWMAVSGCATRRRARLPH